MAPGTLRVPPAAAGTSARFARSICGRNLRFPHTRPLPSLGGGLCAMRVCAANSFGLPGRSPGNAATSASLYVWYLPSLPKANSLACRAQSRQCPGTGPEPPSRPGALFYAGALHTRRRSAPRFRNEYSHHTQTKAPLGASAVRAGCFPPADREGPHSQTTPLWRGFLHPTSGERTFAPHANQAPSGRVCGGGRSYPSPALESPSQPNHAPLAAIPAPHFRNEYSQYTQTKAPPVSLHRRRHAPPAKEERPSVGKDALSNRVY